MSISHLPEEILALICDELGRRKDFPSLFGCALTSISLSDPALRTLYRINEQSPLISETDDVENLRRHQPGDFSTKSAQQVTRLRKWALIWRSLIRSSLDHHPTYRPYCLYIRSLNLDNLRDLLQEGRFAGKIEREFFAGDLHRFHIRKKLIATKKPPAAGNDGGHSEVRLALDVVPVLHAVGDAMTKKTALLEELKGPIGKDFLGNWIQRSPRLQGLHLQDGRALGSEAQEAIRAHCPVFRSLRVYAWTGAGADEALATLLGTTSGWQTFELYSGSDIGRQSLNAMNHHAGTLVALKLLGLNDESVRALGCLKECTAVHKLELQASTSSVRLEDDEPDGFAEIVSWLSSCHNLTELSLAGFHDGPSILAQALGSRSFALTTLSLKNFVAHGEMAVAFYAAISEQASLQRVYLNGDGEDTTFDELQILVDALGRLPQLQVLELHQMSDNFTDHHIISLAELLPHLETFHPSGFAITDDVFDALSTLQNLKDMQFFGVTHFTAPGIARFVSKLDRGTNHGLILNLWAVDQEFALSEEEQALLRDLVTSGLDGWFGMTLWRDAESDFEDESD